MSRNLLKILVVLSVAATVAACGGSSPAESAAPPASGAAATGKRVDAATAGSVSGKVTLTGPAPSADVLHISSDPVCLQALGSNTKSDALVVGADGGVENAFVYIKNDFNDYTFDVPQQAVTLDQKGCRYAPRIFGVRVGQAVEIVNSDATLHNIHALPMVNQEFNKGMPQQGSRMQQVFTAPEVMVRFKCDLHAWMTAYAGVMAHPFFAVTAADGSFSIKGLPPGKYDLAVWHEKLGSSVQSIEIAPSQAQTASFALAAK